jgi:hypothetical protein
VDSRYQRALLNAENNPVPFWEWTMAKSGLAWVLIGFVLGGLVAYIVLPLSYVWSPGSDIGLVGAASLDLAFEGVLVLALARLLRRRRRLLGLHAGALLSYRCRQCGYQWEVLVPSVPSLFS